MGGGPGGVSQWSGDHPTMSDLSQQAAFFQLESSVSCELPLLNRTQ